MDTVPILLFFLLLLPCFTIIFVNTCLITMMTIAIILVIVANLICGAHAAGRSLLFGWVGPEAVEEVLVHMEVSD